jgi:hypothetical protein
MSRNPDRLWPTVHKIDPAEAAILTWIKDQVGARSNNAALRSIINWLGEHPDKVGELRRSLGVPDRV